MKALAKIMILNSAQCCMAEGGQRVTREKLESVIFTDDDMLAPFHKRSLYVEAEMNRVAVKKVMVDPDSTVNLIPMSTRHSKRKDWRSTSRGI